MEDVRKKERLIAGVCGRWPVTPFFSVLITPWHTCRPSTNQLPACTACVVCDVPSSSDHHVFAVSGWVSVSLYAVVHFDTSLTRHDILSVRPHTAASCSTTKHTQRPHTFVGYVIVTPLSTMGYTSLASVFR